VLAVRTVGCDEKHGLDLALLCQERRHRVVILAAVRANADLEAQGRRARRIGELQNRALMTFGHFAQGIGELDRMAVAPDRKAGRRVCAVDAGLLHREDISFIAVAFFAPGVVRVGVAFQPRHFGRKSTGPSVRRDPGHRERGHPDRRSRRTLENSAPVDQAPHPERPFHIAPGQGRHPQ